MIPILHAHNPQKIIGTIDVKDDRLCFRFSEPVPRDKIFEIFGDAGISLTELERRGDEQFVTAGEILEFSLSR